MTNTIFRLFSIKIMSIIYMKHKNGQMLPLSHHAHDETQNQ